MQPMANFHRHGALDNVLYYAVPNYAASNNLHEPEERTQRPQ